MADLDVLELASETQTKRGARLVVVSNPGSRPNCVGRCISRWAWAGGRAQRGAGKQWRSLVRLVGERVGGTASPRFMSRGGAMSTTPSRIFRAGTSTNIITASPTAFSGRFAITALDLADLSRRDVNAYFRGQRAVLRAVSRAS